MRTARGVGAAVGGAAVALIGRGVPEYEAKQYEGKLKSGNVLLSVHVDDHDAAKRVKEIYERNGAESISVVGESKVPPRDVPRSRSAGA